MKKLFYCTFLLTFLIFNLFTFTNPNAAVAQQCEGGFCLVDGQRCEEIDSTHRVVEDSSCQDGTYNGTACCPQDEVSAVEGPSSEFFDNLNPLTNEELGGDPAIGEQLTTPGGIMSRLLQFALPIAGMILFVMLLWGGFEILAGAADKQSMEAGRQRITAAIVGFVLLFASYWIIQIIEVIFGVAIL